MMPSMVLLTCERCSSVNSSFALACGDEDSKLQGDCNQKHEHKAFESNFFVVDPQILSHVWQKSTTGLQTGHIGISPAALQFTCDPTQ